MIALDCDTRYSAATSIAAIYNISCEMLEAFLQDFNIDAHYQQTNPLQQSDRELRRVFETKFSIQPKRLDRVYWFHLTRALSSTDFREGLLPLSSSLDQVWQTFFRVFEGTEHKAKLQEIHSIGIPDRKYGLKVLNTCHSGPYAMLVRDVAMQSKAMGNHDYHWLPEIMEDICDGYSQRYNDALYELLSQALVPTTVKFWSANQLGNDCVEAALYYLYLTAHNKPLTLGANTCFDGKNSPIPAEQIIYVHTEA